jgi:hypothetical protein
VSDAANEARWPLRFARRAGPAFLKRSPDAATAEDVRLFQLHLAETGVSICTRNRTTAPWFDNGVEGHFGLALFIPWRGGTRRAERQ